MKDFKKIAKISKKNNKYKKEKNHYLKSYEMNSLIIIFHLI